MAKKTVILRFAHYGDYSEDATQACLVFEFCKLHPKEVMSKIYKNGRILTTDITVKDLRGTEYQVQANRIVIPGEVSEEAFNTLRSIFSPVKNFEEYYWVEILEDKKGLAHSAQ